MKETVTSKTSGDKKEVAVKELKFRVATYGVIIKDDQILLTPWDDCWDFPGGGMEIGESIRDTLIREVREETGMDIDQGPLVTVADNTVSVGLNPNKPSIIRIYYLGLNPRGDTANTDFTKSEQEHSGPPKWFDVEEAKKLRFYPSSINPVEIVEKALKMK
jgi:8-oxo-dGTP diphosphatase